MMEGALTTSGDFITEYGFPVFVVVVLSGFLAYVLRANRELLKTNAAISERNAAAQERETEQQNSLIAMIAEFSGVTRELGGVLTALRADINQSNERTTGALIRNTDAITAVSTTVGAAMIKIENQWSESKQSMDAASTQILEALNEIKKQLSRIEEQTAKTADELRRIDGQNAQTTEDLQHIKTRVNEVEQQLVGEKSDTQGKSTISENTETTKKGKGAPNETVID